MLGVHCRYCQNNNILFAFAALVEECLLASVDLILLYISNQAYLLLVLVIMHYVLHILLLCLVLRFTFCN